MPRSHQNFGPVTSVKLLAGDYVRKYSRHATDRAARAAPLTVHVTILHHATYRVFLISAVKYHKVSQNPHDDTK